MKNKNTLIGLALLASLPLLAFLFTLLTPQHMVVSVANKKFRVDKENPEFTVEQSAEIKKIVTEEVPPQRFNNRSEFIDYQSYIRIPGLSNSTSGTRTDIGFFNYYEFLLPNSDEHRVLVYFNPKDKEEYILIEDFYVKGSVFYHMEYDNDTLYYFSFQKKDILRKLYLPEL